MTSFDEAKKIAIEVFVEESHKPGIWTTDFETNEYRVNHVDMGFEVLLGHRGYVLYLSVDEDDEESVVCLAREDATGDDRVKDALKRAWSAGQTNFEEQKASLILKCLGVSVVDRK